MNEIIARLVADGSLRLRDMGGDPVKKFNVAESNMTPEQKHDYLVNTVRCQSAVDTDGSTVYFVRDHPTKAWLKLDEAVEWFDGEADV